MNARRWFVPSLSTTLWLAFFLCLTLTNWRVVLISADGDPCLHRRIGDWMIENRQIIRTEQFSHTRLGAPLITKEWLSEVLFSCATRACDWNGLVLVAAALIATTLWLLHRQILRRGTDLLLATGVVLLAANASSSHWLGRPHLFTHLLVVLVTGWLRDFEDGKLSARHLWCLLPVTMWVWTNLHGAFFTGFILIGIFFLAALWDRHWSRSQTLAGIWAASLAASLVNPNGWQLHAQVIGFLRTPELTTMVNEFRSPNFHTGGMRGLLLLFFVLAGSLMVARPRLRASEWLLVAVWGYFALHSARNGPIFALLTGPVIARYFQEFFTARPAGRWINLYRRVNARVTGLHAAAGGGALAALALGSVIYVAGWTTLLPTEIFAERHPVAAVRWLQENPGAVAGAMFNDYGWGGYLLWALPEHKVFMDGRNDFYGRDVVNDFNEVDDLKPGWEEVLARYRVGWTLLPRAHALNSLLALHPGWKQVHADEVAILYASR
jgi:hypothetical protein